MTRLRTREISTDRIASSVYVEGGVGQPAVGQAVSAASSPVVIASDQSGVPVRTLNATSASAQTSGVSPGSVFYSTNSAGTAGIGLVQPVLYNGASVDWERSNLDVALLASAARTATPTKVDQTNWNHRSLIVVIDCTVYPAAASVVFTIQGKDVVSGKYYTILASAAITGTGTTVLRVGPFYSADVANLVKIDTVPRTWAVDAVHTGGDSITYSVGYSLAI